MEKSKSGEKWQKAAKNGEKRRKLFWEPPLSFFSPAGPYNRDPFADSGIHKSRLWDVIYSNHANAIPLEIQDFDWIFYWIELTQNNFELNIFLNWILAFFSDWIIFLNWILTIFFWIENWIESFSTVFFWIKNWIESFSTVFFWIKNWIESFSSEIQSLIESSNCTSQGYIHPTHL